MSQLSRQNYKTTKDSQFADNTAGLITELVMRTFGENTADSFTSNVDDLQKLTTATGTNDYAITAGITSLVSGYMVVVKFANASTADSTLNPNSLGAKKLYINPTTQAGDGDIPANSICLCIYDATLDSSTGGFLIIAGINSINGGTP